MNYGRADQFMEALENLKYEEYDADIAELIDRTIGQAKWIWGWMQEIDHGETEEEEFVKWMHKKVYTNGK